METLVPGFCKRFLPRWFALLAIAPLVALADTPSADYAFPAGGRRGTTVQFRVGAHFLHGGAPFVMEGDGLEATSRVEQTDTIWFEGPMIFKPASQGKENYPKDHLGTVKIAPDAEPGVRYWRLWTSQGAVASRQFIIGDLPEVIEEEIDGRPIPVKVTLPVTINGRMFPREDVDIWEFDAEAGQSITCEVHAARLGSPLDSRIEIRGPAGRRIAENTDHFGSDSFVRFQAPETGSYRLHIHDASFRGLQPFVYRLTVTAGTYIDRVFPLGGRSGDKVKFELAGQHAPFGGVEVELPSCEPGVHLQYFPLGDSLSNPVFIDVSDLPEHVETGPNNEPASDNALAVPAILNGRMETPDDVDCWSITAKKDQKLEFDLAALRHGSPLDGVLTISDAGGKQVAQAGSTAENPIEPEISLTIPEDGVYYVRVEDCLQRGGPEYAYRLSISEPPAPDFRLRLPDDALTLYRGGEAKVKIAVERLNGFKGEVALAVDGLPDGVTVAGATIASGKKDVQLVFKATEKAKVQTALLVIVGTATVNDEPRTRRAVLSGPRGTPDREEIFLAVSMPTPFKLDGVAFQTNYAARGTIHRRRFLLHRNGFKGPLTAALADRQIRHQQGVTGPRVQLPAEATEFQYPIQVPTWLEMNRTGRIVVMAVGEVEDEDGVKHTVSYSSGAVNDQIIILTAPCPMSVRAARTSIRAEPGSTFDLSVEVARGILTPAPVKIELLLPKHMRGVEAAPVTIPADQSSGNFKIRFGEIPGPFNMPVVIRATTAEDGDPVIAETKLEFAVDQQAAEAG